MKKTFAALLFVLFAFTGCLEFDAQDITIRYDEAADRIDIHVVYRGLFAEGVDFCGANLRKSCLSDSFLAGARFDAADLSGTDFSRADLRGASFKNTLLTGADFEGCDLSGADFTGSRIDEARFPGARLDGVKV